MGDVVVEDYGRASVFKRFGIDFCCGGSRSVREACDEAGVALGDLERALASGAGTDQTSWADTRSWDPAFLADYIVQVHHSYVRQALPLLVGFSTKVAQVHGEDRPELFVVRDLVHELAGELERHMKNEEEVVFPRISALVAAQRDGAGERVGLVGESVRTLEDDHDHAGDVMGRIRGLTEGYAAPESACTAYRAMLAKLAEFEEDLHRHVHLENNVLFPRASVLEEELLGVRSGPR